METAMAYLLAHAENDYITLYILIYISFIFKNIHFFSILSFLNSSNLILLIIISYILNKFAFKIFSSKIFMYQSY